MKLSIALLSAALAISHAQPHRHHGHQHLHKAKREQVPKPVEYAAGSPNPAEYPTEPNAAEDAPGPGPTEIVYVLNGELIPEDDVQQGIKNGSLIFAGGQLSSADPPTYEAPSTQAPTGPPAYVAPTPTPSPKPVKTTTTHVAPAPSKPASYPKPPAPHNPKPAPPSYSSGSGGSGSGAWGSDATGVDADFPDGELSCSTFPSEYGAVPVEWTGLGGWTGIQSCGGSDSTGYENIVTKIKGETCSEGDYCSYACPPGYHKSQWPSTQGVTGQSVGGIKCTNGKLHLTNPDLSKKLCIPGAEGVTILIENKLPKNVAVCGTDYPGSEGETVPTDALPGATTNLTCPDADKAYTWKGSSTSAQYYVNPAGVPLEDGCQWGSEANPWGNFAPMNIGVGYTNGAAWLSIFQNAPTTDAKLEFTVEIKGDSISGTCRYSNGQYCGGANYDDCSSTKGCTVSRVCGSLLSAVANSVQVSLTSGTATFVFSD